MNTTKIALKLFITMLVLTGILYPLIMTLIGQVAFPKQANGSLIKEDGKIIGSELIAQSFKNDAYFWPRPSAIDFDPVKPSGGSNYGPTSQKLKEFVQQQSAALKSTASEAKSPIPSEMVYASASGLDPHISLQAAYFQINRVAKSRSLDPSKLKSLVESLSEGNQLGFLGPAYVNVLTLNLYLDKHYPKIK